MNNKDHKIPSIHDRLPHLVVMSKAPETGTMSIVTLEFTSQRLSKLLEMQNVYAMRLLDQEFCMTTQQVKLVKEAKETPKKLRFIELSSLYKSYAKYY